MKFLTSSSKHFSLFFTAIATFVLLSGCAAKGVIRGAEVAIIIVDSIEDIPDIKDKYSDEIAQLKVGMTKGQVLSLLPNVEQECFANDDVCNFTVFDERRIAVNKKLGDLKLLTGSLVTMLSLTCILSNDSCPEVFNAMLNLGLASALESKKLRSEANRDGSLTLIQWINIEFKNNKVTQWAINEPLEQFKPKSFKNELPPLEESLQ